MVLHCMVRRNDTHLLWHSEQGTEIGGLHTRRYKAKTTDHDIDEMSFRFSARQAPTHFLRLVRYFHASQRFSAFSIPICSFRNFGLIFKLC